MCDNRLCGSACGQQQFSQYCETVSARQVFYPEMALQDGTQYGVMLHKPAQQWEIVAVEGSRTRHVAFVSTLYCLEKVLGLAKEIARRPALVN